MSLFTPEFGLVFWMLVIFLILLGVLGKYAWPVIIKSMEERAAFIDQGVEFTREAEKDREQAKADARGLLTDARKQQLDILQQTERTKQEIIDNAQQTAAHEARRIMESAKLSIEQAKTEAELQLRRQTGLLSLQIAEQVIRRNLASEEAQMELIDQLLKEAGE
ncbi:MAG: F0F1 ATP synthase subunit B [Odoribacteraceae bacterium]|jgi:F-type H+-transporting ATPase subunit b|nr:F0F1 ATP synthase subunit B [Odoribacteraceae bacterium]